MKRLFFLLIAALLVGVGTISAQEVNSREDAKAARQAAKEARQKAKEADKAAAEAEEKALFEEAKAALEAQDFVLEADRVEFKRGNWAYVTPSTNFVSLIDGKATVQLAFNGAFSGPNGIGGITVEGTPSNISLKTDKKGNVNFQMMVQGVGISASVTIRMVNGSAKCTATVSPNFSGNRVSFTGTLYPSSASSVYKGRAL